MAARFKLDENLPRDAVALLRNAGHDVDTVLDERLGGHPDPDVFDACQAENRILVTYDLDFADIRQYPPSGHAGVWILRPSSQSIENALSLLQGALRVVDSETVANRLWILQPDNVRIRE
jgi:predicted nuclease of predicted toxin-antitoxin system